MNYERKAERYWTVLDETPLVWETLADAVRVWGRYLIGSGADLPEVESQEEFDSWFSGMALRVALEIYPSRFHIRAAERRLSRMSEEEREQAFSVPRSRKARRLMWTGSAPSTKICSDGFCSDSRRSGFACGLGQVCGLGPRAVGEASRGASPQVEASFDSVSGLAKGPKG